MCGLVCLGVTTDARGPRSSEAQEGRFWLQARVARLRSVVPSVYQSWFTHFSRYQSLYDTKYSFYMLEVAVPEGTVLSLPHTSSRNAFE